MSDTNLTSLIASLESSVSPKMDDPKFSDLYSALIKLILKKAEFLKEEKDPTELFEEYEVLKAQYDKLTRKRR